MGLSERRENGMESMNEEKELLEHVMKLMAEHFGKNCEIVLHDFMAPDNHTIIGIEMPEIFICHA